MALADQGEVQRLMSEKEDAVVQDAFEARLSEVGYQCSASPPPPLSANAFANESGYNVDVMVKIYPPPTSRDARRRDMPFPGDFADVCEGIRAALDSLEKKFPGRLIGLHVQVDPRSLDGGASPRRSLTEALSMLSGLEREGRSTVTGFTAVGGRFAEEGSVGAEGDPRLSSLHMINLKNSTVSNRGLRRLGAAAPALGELHVNRTRVTTVPTSANFPALRAIGIAGLPIRVEEVLSSGLSIETLYVDEEQRAEYERKHGRSERPRLLISSDDVNGLEVAGIEDKKTGSQEWLQ